jgi:predicted ATP-dependent serine protease
MSFFDMNEMIESADVVFDIRTANEWLAGSAAKRPEPLFGDLWMTGEIGVMFAAPGCGKSVLAMQIAEAIARGRAVAPFECGAKKQKVLYLDLGSAPGHFDMKYAPDEEERNRKPHAFSASLIRVCPTERELTVEDLEPLIERSGAGILIIDSIEHLLNSARSSKEAERAMRELRRLSRVHGLSILVIAAGGV